MTTNYSDTAETAVLGAILQTGKSFDLSEADFYLYEHREIFKAIYELQKNNRTVDFIHVSEYLESKGNLEQIGGFEYVANLQNNIVTANAKSYSVELKKYSRARQAVSIGHTLLETVAEDWHEKTDQAVRNLMSLSAKGKDKQWSSDITQALRDAQDEIETCFQTDGLIGVTTGLQKLDEIVGGWHQGDLIIFAARPAMGKTAFAINQALNSKAPVGFFSAEQPKSQIAQRMIGIVGQVNLENMRTAKLSDDDFSRITQASSTIDGMNIFINDCPAIHIQALINQSRTWYREHGIKALYVDYIQRVKPFDTKAPRHEQVGQVAMALKELARELRIPVIVLAQVNRNVESRTDKRPYMGDLKDSGTIEQEADFIGMLYRDEVYNPGSSDTGIAEILIEKNRHGRTGKIKVQFDAEYVRFRDLRTIHSPESYQRAVG